MRSFRHKIVAFLRGTVIVRRTEQEYERAFLDTPHHFESSFVLELGKEEEKAFDPNSLDADRCESCYGRSQRTLGNLYTCLYLLST